MNKLMKDGSSDYGSCIQTIHDPCSDIEKRQGGGVVSVCPKIYTVSLVFDVIEEAYFGMKRDCYTAKCLIADTFN